jgi:hypothetical protein
MSRELAEQTIEVCHEILAEGIKGYSEEAARRFGLSIPTIRNRLRSAKANHGLEVDESHYRPKRAAAAFSVDPLPDDGEPDAETLIALLKDRHAKRLAVDEAARLRQVQIHTPGPIALAFFGDPHVDDPGCAWGDLERDVTICRDTPGIFAIGVGDHRNNWIGRLMALYANQEVTSKQSIVLIEWLFSQIPWLLNIGGNHDKWGSDHGDVVELMHKLKGFAGLYENDGTRLQLNLPSGAEVRVHVRHDFPGQSQFNGAHAMVRETLFGFRDHILACGHRHSSAYMPIWHNDPRRLCHGFRCGSYKDFDKYQKEKHFKEENWARSLAAVIDPAFAHDPVRFIKPFFSLEEAADYLKWMRRLFESGRAA